jgi:hypothetical protein
MSWVAVATVASSVISSYMGNRAAKKARRKTADEKEMIRMMVDQARTNGEFGKWLMQLARPAIGNTAEFANQAATGDRETLMRLAGDDFRGISEGAQQTLQTMSQLSPRTGAGAEFLSRLPYDVARGQQQVLSGYKQQGRDMQANLGTNLAQIGSNIGNQASSGAYNLLNYNQNAASNARQVGSDTAAGTYQTLMGIFSAWQNRNRPQGDGAGGGNNNPFMGSMNSNRNAGAGGTGSSLTMRPNNNPYGQQGINQPFSIYGGRGG